MIEEGGEGEGEEMGRGRGGEEKQTKKKKNYESSRCPFGNYFFIFRCMGLP